MITPNLLSISTDTAHIPAGIAICFHPAEEEKQIIADVNTKAQAELAEIRKKIVKDAETASASLQEKVDEFANDICQKILGRKV